MIISHWGIRLVRHSGKLVPRLWVGSGTRAAALDLILAKGLLYHELGITTLSV
jgi:hypothetical protein